MTPSGEILDRSRRAEAHAPAVPRDLLARLAVVARAALLAYVPVAMLGIAFLLDVYLRNHLQLATVALMVFASVKLSRERIRSVSGGGAAAYLLLAGANIAAHAYWVHHAWSFPAGPDWIAIAPSVLLVAASVVVAADTVRGARLLEEPT
ncbi:MAG TPA: hypothetical protein VLW45_08000 [Pelomicrobium sp.]|nr:hypothetical protein [Pelomicrobium sp.]